MICHTIRVIYLESEMNMFYRNRQIRIFKITVLYIEIGMIGRKMFFIVFSSDESIKINLSVRFNAGEIFLIERRQHGKDIFELGGRRFEFDVHVVTAVIDPLKESFGMQFQIIERYLVGIKGIGMGFIVHMEGQIHLCFSSKPGRDGSHYSQN